MSCCDREKDLLLLAHGALSPVRRLLTETHIRRCPRCRERQERFGTASRLLAETIRGHDLPVWRPLSATVPVRRPETRRARWVLALSLLLAVVSIAALFWRIREFLPAASASPVPVGAEAERCGPLEPPLPAKITPQDPDGCGKPHK